MSHKLVELSCNARIYEQWGSTGNFKKKSDVEKNHTLGRLAGQQNIV